MAQILSKIKQGAWLNHFIIQIYQKLMLLKFIPKDYPKLLYIGYFENIRESGTIDRKPESGRKYKIH